MAFSVEAINSVFMFEWLFHNCDFEYNRIYFSNSASPFELLESVIVWLHPACVS